MFFKAIGILCSVEAALHRISYSVKTTLQSKLNFAKFARFWWEYPANRTAHNCLTYCSFSSPSWIYWICGIIGLLLHESSFGTPLCFVKKAWQALLQMLLYYERKANRHFENGVINVPMSYLAFNHSVLATVNPRGKSVENFLWSDTQYPVHCTHPFCFPQYKDPVNNGPHGAREIAY